ncbi:MAG: hypothetical protein KAG64_07600 [Bacteroidales bacterium]|nr:hypothetical protein [Bacteroidales bacterium]
MRFHKIQFVVLLIIIALSISCTTEIKLARSIQKDMNQISVLCDYPDHIILTNSLLELPNNMSEEESNAFYDSAYSNSQYIRYIDDTIFLRKFKEYSKSIFENYNVNYYEEEDIDAFLSSAGELYIINYKQLELEERWENYHDKEWFGNMLYEEDFWIMGLSLNAWIDVAKINDTVEIQRHLYIESVLVDEVDGMFFQNQWTGDVNYQYRLDSLEVSDVGELQYQSADEFSYHVINFVINKEIRDRLNSLEELEPMNEWFLSPGSGRLIPRAK